MDSKDKLVTLEDLKVVHDEVSRYTTCSTAASTAAKTATLTNFVLTTGSAVKVKFTNTNTAANPTLNINSTGAKPIMQYGTTVAGTTATDSWDAGAIVEFVYDGTNWVMQGRNTIDAVSKSAGGTFNGDVSIVKTNTGTGEAISKLTLGNNIDWGSAGNTYGAIDLYSGHTQKVTLFAGNPTADRELTCPDVTGTIMTDKGGIFNGNIVVNRQDGTTSAVGESVVSLGNNISEGTAKNSRGIVQLYAKNAYYTNIYPVTNSANRAIQIPDASGTMAVEQVSTSWAPQLYDYETHKVTLPTSSGGYVRYGRIAIYYMNFNYASSITFSQMLQVRGFPTGSWILGGNIYCAGVSGSFGDRTIQTAQNAVYVRPNWTGTTAANAWWTGCFIVLLPA